MQNYPAWYQSSTGPGVSQTIINIIGNVLPILNLVLAKHGVNILPESINDYISMGVFLYFSIRAGIGYVKSKKIMGERILSLQAKLEGAEMKG